MADAGERAGPILLAPDKFKGAFTAPEVAEALAEGVRAVGGVPMTLPIADGGEGTARALLAARGGELRRVAASDPLGRELSAEIALLADGRTAALDTASASGLALLAEGELDPWAASSAGTGELILAAIGAGAETVVVGAGGSATVDGGAGAVAVLRAAERLPRLIVACDARTVWERAAEVYGPQKGADRAMVERLALRLERVAADAPRDPRGIAMSGCAGGLSGALWAHFDAELVAGADYVLDAAGFDEAAVGAGSVITGEGRIDSQTLEGKAVGAIASRSRSLRVPCDAVVAVDALTDAERGRIGLRRIVTAGTLERLRAAGEELAVR